MEQALAIGSLLDSRYKIIRVISTDSLGAIYEVVDTKITEGAYVAQEFFPAGATAEKQRAKENNVRETAEFLKTLEHPHLIRVFNFFPEGNRSYLITEEVDGLSLASLITLTSTPISERESLDWFIQACDALDYLHHRAPPFYFSDLNPAVMIVDRDGHIKIGGFGMSLLLAEPGNLSNPYIAPELKSGEPRSPAADIFSMAATFYFLLTRQTPKPSPESTRKFNPQVSENTDKLILRCLRLEPVMRPDSAANLRASISEILHPLQVSPPAISKTGWSRKFRTTAQSARKILEKIVLGGAMIVERPYLIVLVALLFWVIHANFHSLALKRFHKHGPLLYVACRNEVVVVDPAALQVVDRLPRLEDTFAISASLDAAGIWFANRKGDLVEINTNDDEPVSQFSAKQPIGGIACAAKNLLLASLDQDNTLGVFAAATGRAIAFSPVGRLPKDILYSRRRNEIYLTDSFSKKLVILDPQYVVKQTVPLDSVPSHMAQGPDENYIYLVSDDSSNVEVIDAEIKSRVKGISLPVPGPYSINAHDHGIVVTALNQNKIFLYDYPGEIPKTETYLKNPKITLYLNKLGKIIAVTANGYLYAVDPSTGKAMGHVRVGRSPITALFVP